MSTPQQLFVVLLYSYSLSPLNFRFPPINKKRNLSCPSFKSKYSFSIKENSSKNKTKIFLYDSNEKEKDTNSSKKTKSNSILTNTTNANTINDEKKMNKVYASLTNIISKFILDEEFLLNSSNFFPKNLSKLPIVIDINRNQMENEKCYYYKKLSENIVFFYETIMKENEKIFPSKRRLISIVAQVISQSINTSLKQYNIINLILYGSQASGLSLPESDIDLLLIYCDSNNSLDKFISELYNILLTSKKFNSVTSLPKASSPLIKIEYKINPYFQYNDISFIHIDISFHNIFPKKNSIFFTPSLLIVKYIQKSIEYLPQSKNVIIVIKKYLKNLGLNNYYTGGLNSFSVFIMVFAFYKYIIKIYGNDLINSLYIGQFLVQFLDFYSKFNFNDYIININQEMPFVIKDSSKLKNIKENEANAIILDPFTLNNIACNSFRICEIQEKFDSLKQNLLVNYDKNYKVKNIYNTEFKKNNRYKNYCNNNLNKKISFEEYETQIDFYNGDVVPNFLEMSIQ